MSPILKREIKMKVKATLKKREDGKNVANFHPGSKCCRVGNVTVKDLGNGTYSLGVFTHAQKTAEVRQKVEKEKLAAAQQVFESYETLARIDLSKFWGGTENYYQHFLGGYYTDGVKYVAKECKAYWLIDAVMSHAPRLLKAEGFPLVLELRSDDEGGAQLVVTWPDYETGESQEEVIQEIECTDFPFARFDGGRFRFLVGPAERRLVMSLIEED